ncbi:MAG: HIT family protein [Erysipelotrichaceae bacterium]|jgi:histidine triad (HIT) family protein|nr:HIT family protein [Erysipelotrichaceae bacterium]
MNDCIFCKIVRGDIPCHKVYEDDDVLAFLDISQTTKGHTLVISKEHFRNLLYVPKDILAKVMGAAQKIAQAQVASLGAKGVNIINNTNEVAGQTVMHFHVHVIPRYSNEDALRLEFNSNKIEKLSLPAIAEEISKEM